jgi:cytochrome o ubiquinol oxidase operon protein cyoD
MSHTGHEPSIDDTSPGNVDAGLGSGAQGILSYLLGYVLAILLTVASFYTVGSGVIWKPGIPVALIVLAIAQIGIHLVFFLHINTAPDNANNILALGFGILIVALIVGGSAWIMAHLNGNMMPVDQMMRMQR